MQPSQPSSNSSKNKLFVKSFVRKNRVRPAPSILRPAETPVSLREAFLGNGVHLGKSTRLRHPGMQGLLLGSRNGQDQFDVDLCLAHWKTGLRFFKACVEDPRTRVLFVGSASRGSSLTRILPKLVHKPHGFLTLPWPPGFIQNWEDRVEIPRYKYRTNPSYQLTKAQHNRYNRFLRNLTEKAPDLVVFVRPPANGALKDCWARGIPRLALLDSSDDPRYVTYPIPGNARRTLVQWYFLGFLLEVLTKETRKLKPNSNLTQTQI